ncbi:hypothetical protein [Nonomuraea maritima]|uniref:hypothetical protein n=1 Tax=Nonomuraea maritima TaxID=683260 RepID=UPI00371D8442
MSARILVQVSFALLMLLGAVGLIASLWRAAGKPRITADGDQVARGREPHVLTAVIAVVIAAALTAVWASGPDD